MPKRKIDDNAVNKLVQKGRDALKEDRFEDAILFFRRAIKLAPFRQDIKESLAEALDRQPLPSSPEEKPPKKTPKTPRSRKKPRKNGIRFWVWLLIFMALCMSSLAFFFFFSTAIQEFVGNLGKNREQRTLSPSDREAAELYRKAVLLQDQRRFSEAIQALKDAIEKEPSNLKQFEDKLGQLYFEMGEQQYKKDEYLEAVKNYEKAVRYDPSSTDHHYGLGWANYMQGRKNQNRRRSSRPYFEKGRDSFLKILEMEPENTRALNALARIYIAMNDSTRAADMYRRIIRLAPDSREAERASRALKSMQFKQ